MTGTENDSRTGSGRCTLRQASPTGSGRCTLRRGARGRRAVIGGRASVADRTGSGRCTLRRGARGRQTVVGGRLPMDLVLGDRRLSTHYPLLPTCYGQSDGVRPLHVAARRNRSVDGGRWSVADRFGTGVSSTVYLLPATAYSLLVGTGGRGQAVARCGAARRGQAVNCYCDWNSQAGQSSVGFLTGHR
jgi:hypothetical protein